MKERDESAFDRAVFLANEELSRKIVPLKAKETLFSQGSPAGSIFYLQTSSKVTSTRQLLPAASLHKAAFSSMAAAASPFMEPMTASQASATIFGSLKWVVAMTMALARETASARSFGSFSTSKESHVPS